MTLAFQVLPEVRAFQVHVVHEVLLVQKVLRSMAKLVPLARRVYPVLTGSRAKTAKTVYKVPRVISAHKATRASQVAQVPSVQTALRVKEKRARLVHKVNKVLLESVASVAFVVHRVKKARMVWPANKDSQVSAVQSVQRDGQVCLVYQGETAIVASRVFVVKTVLRARTVTLVSRESKVPVAFEVCAADAASAAPQVSLVHRVQSAYLSSSLVHQETAVLLVMSAA